jgi:hypothetical protein
MTFVFAGSVQASADFAFQILAVKVRDAERTAHHYRSSFENPLAVCQLRKAVLCWVPPPDPLTSHCGTLTPSS